MNNNSLPFIKEEDILNGKLYGILGIILYFTIVLLITSFPLPYYVRHFLTHITVIIAFAGIFHQELKVALKDFKKNYKTYIKYILKSQLVMIAIYILACIFEVIVLGPDLEQSINQQNLETLSMWYLVPASVLLAPFVEEYIFRGCFRRIIKNKWIFIIVSGLLFGLLHTFSEPSLLKVFVMALPYGILGSCFAYNYVKTNNILCNMANHSLHNLIICILMLF